MHSGSPHKIALLIFARSSREEVAHKSIYQGARLFDALTQNVLKTADKTKLPYFHCSEVTQVGATFGERFTNAIQAIFEKGYEQIITIGNDSPQLKASHILEAEKQLHLNQSVIGQSTDGGFYLMGVHKAQFDPIAFQQMSWQTSELSKQLLQHLSQANKEVFKLPTLFDIDNQTDVELISGYAHLFSAELRKAVLSTIRLGRQRYALLLQNLSAATLKVHHNKGSPVLRFV